MHLLKKFCTLTLFLLICVCVSCTKDLYKHASDKYVEDSTFKVVGYLSASNFDLIDQIELHRLTHLNLAFANPDVNGDLVFRQEKDIREVVEKAQANGVKTFVSIAGGGIRDEEKIYWKKVLQSSNRAEFIEKIVAYVEKNNLDGVDVDIEGNLLPTIGKTYNPFVLDLKKALHARGKGITAALPGTWLHEAVSQKAIEAFDFINVMVYDDTGPWNPDKPGPHAPFSFAERSISFWVDEKKIPSHRLVLGMPFYGYDFSIVGSKVYSQIVRDNPADAYRDEIGLLYYNGIPTIVKKTQLAMEKVNGVMFWELGQDAFNELSLLRTVDQILKAGNCEGGTVSTYFADLDGDGFGDLSRPIQACTLPEGYVINNQDCDDSNAAVHPEATEIEDSFDHNCNGKFDE